MDMEKWVEDLGAAWSSHDVEKILSFYADDCVYEDHAVGKVSYGKEELRAFVRASFAAYPDYKFEIRSSFASGNHVCIECIWSGTHTGDYPGLPATGKTFSVPGVHICELTGSKARRAADYCDMVTVMRQLGILPAAPQS